MNIQRKGTGAIEVILLLFLLLYHILTYSIDGVLSSHIAHINKSCLLPIVFLYHCMHTTHDDNQCIDSGKVEF